jgi:tight adherence protein B
MSENLAFNLGCLFIGLAVATAGFSGKRYTDRMFATLERDMADKLSRMRKSSKHLRKYLVAWMIGIGGVFCVCSLVLDNFIFAFIFSIFLLCMPWYLLRRMAERHRQRIEDQLADAMVTLANAVRAGLSLPQSLEILAAQCPRPINAEFHQIVAEYNLGKPLDRSLIEAKERLRSENFALFTAAMMASHESGGRLNETVERIANSVMELQRLDRKVQSETAQARKSAIYMAMAPAFILILYYFVDPRNTSLLFTNLVGQILLGVAIVFNVIAYFWARVILHPDI